MDDNFGLIAIIISAISLLTSAIAAKELLPRILVWVQQASAKGVVVTGLGVQPTNDPFIKRHDAKEIGPLIRRIRQRHGVGAPHTGFSFSTGVHPGGPLLHCGWRRRARS